MTPAKAIPSWRWPSWLNATALLAASFIATATLSLEVRPGAEIVAVAFGMMRGTDWMLPAGLMVAMALAATLSWRAAGNALSTRLIFAVALLGEVSVFTFQFAGHPWQVDTHMYFFAALASLVAYCDY